MLTFSRRLRPILLLFILAAIVIAAAHRSSSTTYAQGGGPLPGAVLCFSVADSQDRLHAKYRATGLPDDIVGPTGRLNIEALALNLDNTRLYTVDQFSANVGQFGYLQNFLPPWGPGSGQFVLIGTIGSGANAARGSLALADVDGLSFDPRRNALWATTQGFNNNALFQINVATGQPVRDLFGTGFDYARINLGVVGNTVPVCGGGTIACTNCPNAVDDIAVNPVTGAYYIIANDLNGTVQGDFLYRLQIDPNNPANSPGFNPATGDISACAIGQLRLPDNTPINDMEGLAFYNDGSFYGTTGTETVPTQYANSMWTVDVNSGVVNFLDPTNPTASVFSNGDRDFEGTACLTAGANLITGTVYLDGNAADGEIFKPGTDTGQGGVTVELLLNGEVVQTTTTAPDGTYSFTVAVTGNFALRIVPATLPAGAMMTTDNADTANFPTWNLTDINNDFGYNLGGPTTVDLAITKDDGVTTYTPGGTLVYSIIVTNAGPADAVGATVTDTFPAAFTSATWTCTGSGGGTCTASGSGTINDTVNVPVGAVLTYTVTAAVSPTAAGNITNTATVSHPDDSNPTNNTDTDTDTPPGAPTVDLAISKTDGVNNYTPGGTLIYTINVTNVGTADAANATVTDVFPPEFTAVSWTCASAGGGTCTAGPVSGNISDTVSVPVGARLVYTVTATVSASASGRIVNTATVAHPDDSNPANNTSSDPDDPPGVAGVPIAQANPVISKRGDPPTALPGDIITWTITVSNPTGTPMTNVTVTDPVDGTYFTEIIRAASSKGTSSVSGLSATYNIGTLAPNETVILTLVTRLRSNLTLPATAPNVATLRAAELADPLTARASVNVPALTLPSTGYPPAETGGTLPAWAFSAAGAGVLLAMGLAGLVVWRKRR